MSSAAVTASASPAVESRSALAARQAEAADRAVARASWLVPPLLRRGGDGAPTEVGVGRTERPAERSLGARWLFRVLVLRPGY